jgi:hypothetical protein
MDSLARLSERLRGGLAAIDQGFLVGVAIGLALPLVFYVLLGILRHGRRCRGVRIVGAGGVLFVSVAAVREFVRRLVDELADASFHLLELERRGTGYVFNISVDVAPEADMIALREELNVRLRAEADRRLGLEGQVLEVNVVIHRLLASERKWQRRKGDVADEAERAPAQRGG